MEEAINYLFLQAAIATPTQRDIKWATEAVIHGNPDYWVGKPVTCAEHINKKIFEIKSFSYFMRKRNYTNPQIINYLREKEHIELSYLLSMQTLY